MDRLKAAGLKLKASKCQWFKCSVKYLGHVVSAKGLQCDPEKIEAVQNWPVPQTVTQVGQFLGFAAYYRKFSHNFSKIAQPLTNLTKNQSVSLGMTTVKTPLRDSNNSWSQRQQLCCRSSFVSG